MALHRPGAHPPSPLAPTAASSPWFFRSSSALSFTRLLVTFLVLHSLSFSPFAPTSNLVEAIQCTYPNYNTQVSPGETTLLTWVATGSDLESYDTVSATLYCMDLSGPVGGMWRVIETIFQNRGLVSAQNQYQFSVPNCGSLARNVAVRIIAKGKNVESQDNACQFTMKAAQVSPPQTTTLPPPVVKPSVQPTQPPKTQPSTIVTTSKGDASLSTTSTTPGIATSSTAPASLATSLSDFGNLPTDYPYPGDGYYPLPPLPPLTDEEKGGTAPQPNSSTGGTYTTKFKTIGTILGSICVFVVLIAATTLLVMWRRRMRRKRSRRQNSDGLGMFGGHGGGMREKMKTKGRAIKGANKSGQKEGEFHLMRDDDDDDDNYNDNYKSDKGCNRMIPSLLDTGNDPNEQQLDAEKGEMTGSKGCYRDSTLSYPPSAYLDPTWSPSAAYPYPHSEDEYTMSSMRSSCETSSVVRKYWAASMAARAERRLDGFPPSRDYFDQGSVSQDRAHAPSFSSESRKADILSFDESSIAPSRTSVGTGLDIATTTTTRGGPFQRHYRNTLNSVNDYIRQSMSMSLASLGSTDNESWHGRHGFRPSINAEFLDHLNIKSVQSEQRQHEYYKHYYHQNPTMTTIEQSVSCSKSMTTGSWRTSSVPSLTSTNDPFKTFDSNEVLLDMGPFSDNHAITPRPSSALVPSPADLKELTPPLAPFKTGSTVEAEARSNSGLLRSFPIPPVILSTSASSPPMSSLE